MTIDSDTSARNLSHVSSLSHQRQFFSNLLECFRVTYCLDERSLAQTVYHFGFAHNRL